MSEAQRFDHIGITVEDLDGATAFFVALGLEQQGETQIVEGEFVSTVVGLDDVRVEVAMLQLPEGGTKLELSRFLSPAAETSPPAPANRLGLRNVCFEVDDLQKTIDRVSADGFDLVGGIGTYEDTDRMACVRGPEGIIVSLAERIG